MGKNCAEQVAEFANSIAYDTIPKDVIEQAKIILLHTVGCSIASVGYEPTDHCAKLAENKGGTQEATVWGYKQAKVPVSEAMLANGTAADTLDWEDCTWTGHASAGTIPAVLAFGERNKSSGKEVLEAIVSSYEAYQRLAMAVQPDFETYLMQGNGWGMTTWQIFSSAIAGAKLCGFDEGQMAMCIALSAHITPQLITNWTGDFYHYTHGVSAKAGADAVLFTEMGFEYFTEALEGKNGFWELVSNQVDWSWLSRGLHTEWFIKETLLKRWPANVWGEGPLDCIDEIVTKNKVTGKDIDKIEIWPQIDIFSRPISMPLGLVQAEYCLQYCIAKYLDGDEPRTWHLPEKRADMSVMETVEKISYPGPKVHRLKMFKEWWAGNYPESIMTVTCKDGKQYTSRVPYPKGHPQNPFTMDEEEQHFIRLTTPIIGWDKAQKFFDCVKNLESVKDINEITGYLAAN